MGSVSSLGPSFTGSRRNEALNMTSVTLRRHNDTHRDAGFISLFRPSIRSLSALFEPLLGTFVACVAYLI